MKELTFIIYGAGSDIVAPIFEEFPQSDFICLINKNKPSYLKGEIIQTGNDLFLDQLKDTLQKVDKSRMLVFINAAVFQKDELFPVTINCRLSLYSISKNLIGVTTAKPELLPCTIFILHFCLCGCILARCPWPEACNHLELLGLVYLAQYILHNVCLCRCVGNYYLFPLDAPQARLVVPGGVLLYT